MIATVLNLINMANVIVKYVRLQLCVSSASNAPSVFIFVILDLY